MKTASHARSLGIASALLLAGIVTPTLAQADVAADLSISSMYLWRGLDISDGKPVLASTVKYTHASGFYAGTWFSNEGMPGYGTEFIADTDGDGISDIGGDIALGGSYSGSYELDLYLGYAGKAGELGYDVGYYAYLYPEAPGKISDSDIKEYVLGVTYKGISATAYINAESNKFDKYKYFSFGYGIGKVGLHLGVTKVDQGDGYKDMSVSYAFTDAFKWTVSKASGAAIPKDSTQDGLLTMVSYSVPLK